MPDLKVETFFGWDELPEEYREFACEPYSKWDLHSYLVVTYPNGSVEIHSDNMEPEDATFGRDLRWIVPLLKNVYLAGKQG